MISCFSVCLAQPGPEVYSPQRICALNKLPEKDPENDSVRLIRIGLYYYENKLTILIHSYHHQFISEEQVEKEGILLRKQIGVLSKNVIYPVPETGCESQ